MNQKCIKYISIASTDNAFKLNDRAIVIHFKPVGKFVKTGFFPIVTIIADINNRVFFFMQKSFEYCGNSYSNAFVGRNFIYFFGFEFKFKIKSKNFGN